ncbi:hypothetical protein AF332_03870 [Sporosarcina globispora]|uniref:Uncharacterized protein n=1 Tax=Sporosarcina globispora TaxID=1459 RepID=A0A0M0G9C9_SPOGL|nr:hypothetical protein AF332_03870 [Sporosarcina globispora]
MLIRTGEGQIQENQSESGAHSDRRRGNSKEPVRIRWSFGQEKRRFKRTSPNTVLIRSGEEETQENQSEYGGHSDRRRGNSREPVRIRCSFGQGKGKFKRTSPNTVLIRSGEEETQENQSESGGHSDRRRGNSKEPVRIRWSFGQDKGKFKRTSPNTVLIRTGEGEIRKNQSESGGHSDRRRGNSKEPVRIRCSFGQEKRRFKRTSLNTVLIRTGEEETQENQSEYGGHSDRRRGNSKEPVRIRWSFGQKKRKFERTSPNIVETKPFSFLLNWKYPIASPTIVNTDHWFTPQWKKEYLIASRAASIVKGSMPSLGGVK